MGPGNQAGPPRPPAKGAPTLPSSPKGAPAPSAQGQASKAGPAPQAGPAAKSGPASTGPKSGPVQPGPKPTGPSPQAGPAPKSGPTPVSAPNPALKHGPSTGAASEPATTAVPTAVTAPAPSTAAKHPDLDAIHKVGAGESGADRAAVRRIPATASIGTPLRAAVQVRRVDPWSVFKVTGVLAVAGFLIWMIAIAVLYGVLAGMGVWDQVNSSFATIISADGTSEGGNLITAGQLFGFSALFGVFAAIVLTALATIMAYIYNVCADVVGGFEVTLADLD